MRQLLSSLRALVLVLLVASLFGYAILTAQDAPNRTMNSVLLAIAKAPGMAEETFLNVSRNRFADSRVPNEFTNETGFVPVVNHTSRRIEGLMLRTGAGTLQHGWRMIYGLFQIDGLPQYAVLALAPDLSIGHVWAIDEDALVRPDNVVGQAPFPHGLALLRDGSMLAEFDSGFMPIRIDPCGRRMWTAETYGTHAISPTEDQRYAWSLDYEVFRLFDMANGKVVREFTFDDLRVANPDLGIFDMRRIDDNALGANPTGQAWSFHNDAYHANDIEPLPAALAPAFPRFAAGDLLISARSLNLVMVVDPRTLRVKWFNNAYLLRQHDPDWEPNGRISVLDNQNGREFSRVFEFDPANNTHSVRVDGSKYRFYTRIRGKQQALPGGGTLITSSQQGRIFEVDAQGRIAFDLLVHDPARPGQNYAVSEALWSASRFTAIGKAQSCSAT